VTVEPHPPTVEGISGARRRAVKQNRAACTFSESLRGSSGQTRAGPWSKSSVRDSISGRRSKTGIRNPLPSKREQPRLVTRGILRLDWALGVRRRDIWLPGLDL